MQGKREVENEGVCKYVLKTKKVTMPCRPFYSINNILWILLQTESHPPKIHMPKP